MKKKYAISLIVCLMFIYLGTNLVLAKTWKVQPKMSRDDIQSVINRATDGDKIRFQKGVYDFSDSPVGSSLDNSAALVINDKSLKLIGLPGNQIIGPMSELNSKGYGIIGAKAILIINPAGDKNISISNLNFKSFLVGIRSAFYNVNTQEKYSNLKNITIEKCTFTDIHDSTVVVYGLQGNLLIKNNDIYSWRIGIEVSWDINGENNWQPENSNMDISDNNIVMKDDSLPCLPPYWETCASFWRSGLIIMHADLFNVTSNYITGSYGLLAMRLINIGKSIAIRHKALVENNTIDSAMLGIEGNHIKNVLISKNTFVNIHDVGLDVRFDSANNEITFNSFDLKATLLWGWGYFSPAIWVEGYNSYYAYNTITGYGTAAVIIRTRSGYKTENLIFECNNVLGFTPTTEPGPTPQGGAHYFIFPDVLNCIIRETWNPGITYIDMSDPSSNQFLTVECK